MSYCYKEKSLIFYFTSPLEPFRHVRAFNSLLSELGVPVMNLSLGVRPFLVKHNVPLHGTSLQSHPPCNPVLRACATSSMGFTSTEMTLDLYIWVILEHYVLLGRTSKRGKVQLPNHIPPFFLLKCLVLTREYPQHTHESCHFTHVGGFRQSNH